MSVRRPTSVQIFVTPKSFEARVPPVFTVKGVKYDYLITDYSKPNEKDWFEKPLASMSAIVLGNQPESFPGADCVIEVLIGRASGQHEEATRRIALEAFNEKTFWEEIVLWCARDVPNFRFGSVTLNKSSAPKNAGRTGKTSIANSVGIRKDMPANGKKANNNALNNIVKKRGQQFAVNKQTRGAVRQLQNKGNNGQSGKKNKNKNSNAKGVQVNVNGKGNNTVKINQNSGGKPKRNNNANKKVKGAKQGSKKNKVKQVQNANSHARKKQNALDFSNSLNNTGDYKGYVARPLMMVLSGKEAPNKEMAIATNPKFITITLANNDDWNKGVLNRQKVENMLVDVFMWGKERLASLPRQDPIRALPDEEAKKQSKIYGGLLNSIISGQTKSADPNPVFAKAKRPNNRRIATSIFLQGVDVDVAIKRLNEASKFIEFEHDRVRNLVLDKKKKKFEKEAKKKTNASAPKVDIPLEAKVIGNVAVVEKESGKAEIIPVVNPSAVNNNKSNANAEGSKKKKKKNNNSSVAAAVADASSVKTSTVSGKIVTDEQGKKWLHTVEFGLVPIPSN